MVEFLVTGFYVGRAKFAPGTWGTLVGVPFVFIFSLWGGIAYMALTLALLFASIFLCEIYENEKGGHDHKEVVIDEIVGFLVTMTWLPLHWQSLVAGFVLFRFFDILKPFPIRYIDKNMGGGLGVVADDIAAGVIANIILQIIYSQTNWLGLQLI